ncbi:MAG: carbon-nitrogen hydrolase family protein [Candidatus Methanomethylophilaceae archaeon]|nr:carbon-nitrogen hydrolase family protein [Candidatus Methanomethylophilaceae archaeon]
MKVGLLLCQLRPSMGDPESNAKAVIGLMGQADVLVLPEMFLTGYGTPADGLECRVEGAVGMLSDACKDLDKAVAVGSPRWTGAGIANSLLFLSPDGDAFYDKAHLARFGAYSEDGFVSGERPGMGSYHGMRFGLCVCYDVFFPEVLHGRSLEGASVNLCCAASGIQSKTFVDTVLPARALENVSYLAYVNNVGPMAGLEMHGCSRGLDPFGRTIAECKGVGTARMTVDTETLKECREARRHLVDYRRDIGWT